MTARLAVWLAALVGLAAGAALIPGDGSGGSPLQELWAAAEEEHEEEEEGFDPQAPAVQRPTVAAAFARESYAPGAVARLVPFARARRATVQIFRVGPEQEATRGKDELQGVPVSPPRAVARLEPGRGVRIRIGDWESGFYFARIEAAGGRIGFAPVIVRPRRLGTSRVAVVLPTYTWQAYNFRDDDGDGRADTWYAGWRTREVRLNRPFLNRGVPPQFRRYDLPFLRWLAATGRSVDVLSDRDLGAARSSETLARVYDLIVFPGHHEYVTRREYDLVTGFRDAGGNLMFLSANNFFWQVEVRGDVMRRVALWRQLGRPEAGLIGVQYRANDSGLRRGPWVVRNAASVPWLFAGTRLEDGAAFSSGGIEIDSVAPSSPRNVTIVAEIRDVYGPGYTAHMTYYRARSGAEVFAAGAFSIASSLWLADVRKLMENLWARFAPES